MKRGKREREPACPVCGHYHKWEQGEICHICGHHPAASQDKGAPVSAFPSEILPEFLYIGSYDNASRNELLKAIGVRYILNTVPGCQNLYRNSFQYFNVADEGPLAPLDDCLRFIEEAAKKPQSGKVLVHCMTGISRSASVVIAYLMKHRGWPYAQSLKWVCERRPCVKPSPAAHAQLLEFEFGVFGKNSTDFNILQDQPQFGGPPCHSPFGLIPSHPSTFIAPSAPNAPSPPFNFSPNSMTGFSPMASPTFSTSFSTAPSFNLSPGMAASTAGPFVFGSSIGMHAMAPAPPADEGMDF
mmetsp:Transcript_20952/g.35126  ORF Transcript_20952/g.35126 Transcript_20952/m.35126 type:complete len:299 (+) Transcript_20952:489-1385(+)|eukprot:CAMPEP_0198208602 /NCGR_PEP_ID=MMETSP1445-20131203/11944_1 /TAXON_ID=36898 /ORGANISM="Pyramimonas sp., Strain CCMP2087" /LENGTH=298 /DNA_ID=CAMNT_0043882055 /DNA_START=488 /DNA_END=1384 /DNA_ORIENTATION=-